MKPAGDWEDEGVPRMVEESVEHAFTDMAARRWVEAKLKANELLLAARKGLPDCASDLDSDTKARIEQALQNVEAALATEKAGDGTGDVKQLQAASAAL